MGCRVEEAFPPIILILPTNYSHCWDETHLPFLTMAPVLTPGPMPVVASIWGAAPLLGKMDIFFREAREQNKKNVEEREYTELTS